MPPSAYARAEAVNPKADLTTGRAAALMNSGAPQEARDLLRATIAKRKAPDAALLYLLAESQRQMKDLDSCGRQPPRSFGRRFPTTRAGW